MGLQNVLAGSRLEHVRALKQECARLKAENDALRTENAAWTAHFALALTAAEDLRGVPAGRFLEIWDGWNMILGSDRVAHSRAELVAQAKRALTSPAAPHAVWIVFDGAGEGVVTEGRLRVSYTGGRGPHRADRLVCDYVRMAAYLGLADRVRVRTHDRDFLKSVTRLAAGNAPRVRASAADT